MIKYTLFFTLIFGSVFAKPIFSERIHNSNYIYVKPYYIYSKQVFLNRIFPHVAIDVKSCNNDICKITSYGKVSNGKVYSPDILTVGRNCSTKVNYCSIDKVCPIKKCKNVSVGYSKKYLTDNWLKVTNINAFNRYISDSINKPKGYNLLFQNCATWTTDLLKAGGIKSFSCGFMGIDIPFACGL